MKKLFLLALIIGLMAGCQTQTDEQLEDVLMLKSGKLDICHWDADNMVYIPISVPEVAYQKAHMDHGDKLCFSPRGKYVFHKVTERPNVATPILGDYEVEIDNLEVGSSDFTGSGVRYLDDGRVAYITITGTIELDKIAFKIDQDVYKDEIYQNSNWWELEGHTDQCGGITDIIGVGQKESATVKHTWTLKTVVEV